MQKPLVKWLITIGAGLLIALIPPPEGVPREAWMLSTIFIATVGLIASLINITIWAAVGSVWWKFLGWW